MEKSKKRKVTNKNLLGGLLGGVFGILISGYLHVWALPLGVLAGVMLGW